VNVDDKTREFMLEVIVEDLAEVLYRHSAGMTDDEYEDEQGEPRKAWECTTASFDANPNELTEWERDEYRLQARAVCKKFLSALVKMGWKSANHRPPSDQRLLVHNRDGSVEVETYDAKLGWGNPFNGFRDACDAPTHWMSIPALPDEKADRNG
jgi:hypothetical protein